MPPLRGLSLKQTGDKYDWSKATSSQAYRLTDKRTKIHRIDLFVETIKRLMNKVMVSMLS